MSPNPAKSEAIQRWPTPSNIADVRKFLGLASYYRRYIKNFSHIAAPLHALTEKGALFNWDDSCEAAFSDLKRKLVNPPILVYCTLT